MRSFTAILTILALTLTFGSAPAAMMGDGQWSANLDVGGALNVADGDRADLFPNGFAASGDLYYHVNPNFSVVPVSIAWHVYNYDQMANGVTEGVLSRVPADIDSSPSVVDVEGSAWGIGYMPGLYFNTASDNRINLFGQVGAGVYMYDETFDVYNMEETMDETSFAARASAGFSFRLTQNTDLSLRSGYMYVDTDQARDKFVEFSGGFKYMF